MLIFYKRCVKYEKLREDKGNMLSILGLIKRVSKIFDLRVFWEKGIDNLDTVIGDASNMKDSESYAI